MPHRSTIFRLRKELNMGSKIEEEATPARAVATLSIWNAVSFEAMNCGPEAAGVDASNC